MELTQQSPPTVSEPAGLKVWLLASRPKTLTAAVVPVLVGSSLVGVDGLRGEWWVTVCALMSTILIQVGTNFFNDVLDFKKGADNHERIGPRRVTQQGWVTPGRVATMAVICFVLAMLLGLPLVFKGGAVILTVGILALLLGYAYTGGPYPLAYNGLGDFFVLVFFGWIAVGGMYYLHTATYGWSAAIAGTQIGCLATVLIAINNLRDHQGDRKVKKRTLAVRFGVDFARAEILLLTALPFALSGYWWGSGNYSAALLPLIVLPLGATLVRGIYRTEPGPTYNKFLGQAALLHLSFGLLLSLGFLTS